MGHSLEEYLSRRTTEVLLQVLHSCSSPDATEYERYVADMVRRILDSRKTE